MFSSSEQQFCKSNMITFYNSLAVEGLDPEKIGIEEILVSKEAEFFVEEHIQNPPKSTLGKLFYSKLKFAIKNVHETCNNTYTDIIRSY